MSAHGSGESSDYFGHLDKEVEYFKEWHTLNREDYSGEKGVSAEVETRVNRAIYKESLHNLTKLALDFAQKLNACISSYEEQKTVKEEIRQRELGELNCEQVRMTSGGKLRGIDQYLFKGNRKRAEKAIQQDRLNIKYGEKYKDIKSLKELKSKGKKLSGIYLQSKIELFEYQKLVHPIFEKIMRSCNSKTFDSTGIQNLRKSNMQTFVKNIQVIIDLVLTVWAFTDCAKQVFADGRIANGKAEIILGKDMKDQLYKIVKLHLPKGWVQRMKSLREKAYQMFYGREKNDIRQCKNLYIKVLETCKKMRADSPFQEVQLSEGAKKFIIAFRQATKDVEGMEWYELPEYKDMHNFKTATRKMNDTVKQLMDRITRLEERQLELIAQID